MIETWKDIPECPEYQISDLGNVRSCKPYGNTHARSGAWRPIKQHMLTPKRVYRYFGANVAGRKVQKLIHRTVLEAFRGPSPGMDAAHLNGNPLDNRLENLVWATRKENMEHSRGHGTMVIGTKHKLCKLREIDVLAIKELAAGGKICQKTMAHCFGVSEATIHKIIIGKSWKHVDPAKY